MRRSILSVAAVLVTGALILGAGPSDTLAKNSPNLFGASSTPAPMSATPTTTVPPASPVLSTPHVIKHSAKSHSKVAKHTAKKTTKLSTKKHGKTLAKKTHKHSAAKVAK